MFGNVVGIECLVMLFPPFFVHKLDAACFSISSNVMDQTARVSSQKTVRYLQLLTYMFFPIELCDDINEAFFNDFLPK